MKIFVIENYTLYNGIKALDRLPEGIYVLKEPPTGNHIPVFEWQLEKIPGANYISKNGTIEQHFDSKKDWQTIVMKYKTTGNER